MNGSNTIGCPHGHVPYCTECGRQAELAELRAELESLRSSHTALLAVLEPIRTALIEIDGVTRGTGGPYTRLDMIRELAQPFVKSTALEAAREREGKQG